MALRAVLFDFGGTILDMATDDEAHRRAFAWMAREWALPVDGETLWRQHMEFMEPYWNGQPGNWRPLRDLTRASLERMLQGYGRPVTDAAWDAFWREYLEAHREVIRSHEDATDCLDRLAKLDVHLGLLSDVDIDFLDFALTALNLRHRFDSITTSEEAGVGKPSPRTFELAVQKAGCAPEECVYVGDSVHRDVRGAKGFGMRAIHVVRDGEAAPEADAVVGDLRDAAAIIEDWLH